MIEAMRTWSWSVLVLGVASVAVASTPADRYVVDAASGSVTDTRTKLIWRISWSSGTWSDAKSRCSSLGNGWRLPSLKELLTLVDVARAEPCINPAFTDTPYYPFWTSSSYLPTSGFAWAVNFLDGAANGRDITTSQRIRCVR